jgi:AraC-like DNA-binding protein
MQHEPTCSTSHIRALLQTLEDAGLDTGDVCRACGIKAAILEEVNARIPRSQWLRLWRQTARRLPDSHLGIYLGERARPRAANVVTYLAMSSRTLREALERFIRYQRVLDEGSCVQLNDEGALTFICLQFGSRELPATRDEIEYWAVLLLKYARWIADFDLVLQEVRFSHPAPDDTSEHERIFGCRLRFDAAESGLLIASTELDHPSLHANPEVARTHERFADDCLARLDDCSVERQLRQLLAAVLEQGLLDLQAAAAALHVGVRTLQRRLRDEGTSYRQVVDELRRDVAVSRLTGTDAPIEEITYLTGFSELSPFYRAFRRWTGKTPVEYRAAASERRIPRARVRSVPALGSFVLEVADQAHFPADDQRQSHAHRVLLAARNVEQEMDEL